MARLVPEDYPLDEIASDTERAVVEALLDLADSWFIIPTVRLVDYGVDRELDIVLLHPAMGVVLVEVKGWIPDIRAGAWYDEHGRPQESPFRQARTNSYALRKRLRSIVGESGIDRVPSAVAFPRSGEFTGILPDDHEGFNVLLGPDLSSRDLLAEKIDLLATSAYLINGFGVDAVNAIICELAPDAHFHWDAEREHRRARTMLRTMSRQQVEGFATLDANRRVFVRGRAGTGKTTLAQSWVRRAAADRGERVLLTCYNDPLGRSFALDFDGFEGVAAGPFLRLLLNTPGIPELGQPGTGASKTEVTKWWNETVPEHFATHLPSDGAVFDTIVIDEVQDFSPRWLEVAELLLDPAGSRRMLLLGDDAQNIYGRGFAPPAPDDGWVLADMPRNCRNADAIATLLRRRLDGAKPSPAAPPGWPCRFIEAADLDSAAAITGKLLANYADAGRQPGSIGVVVSGTALRDHLANAFRLRIEPDDVNTCVGTSHRLKGLEFDTVIMAIDEPDIDDVRLYIGVSRAVSELVVVGPASVAERLGLQHSKI